MFQPALLIKHPKQTMPNETEKFFNFSPSIKSKAPKLGIFALFTHKTFVLKDFLVFYANIHFLNVHLFSKRLICNLDNSCCNFFEARFDSELSEKKKRINMRLDLSNEKAGKTLKKFLCCTAACLWLISPIQRGLIWKPSIYIETQ